MKKTIKRAVFLGRFQPFHKGHEYVAKRLLKKYDELVIAIGSAESSISRENPFTASERIEMIRSCFSSAQLAKIIIIPVRDVNDHATWVNHVLRYLPAFEALYSNNELVQHLFNHAGIKAHHVWFYNRHLYTGEKIREDIAKGGKWKEAVPKSVVKLMEKYKVEKRLNHLTK
jgi:nicotinamide-nucleotide adenylyltransferase